MKHRKPKFSLGLAALCAGTLALLAASAPVRAEITPRSMAECERLKNDLAYNQCLAMFGPAAKNIAGGDGSAASAPGPEAAAAIPIAEDPAPEAGSRRRGRRYGRHGRQSASFSTGGSDEGRSYRRRRRRR